jgi:hypothetical protein
MKGFFIYMLINFIAKIVFYTEYKFSMKLYFLSIINNLLTMKIENYLLNGRF